ncbi:MAG: acetate/propionate family kinase [Acidobacteriota bacterium]
MILTVNGGSSSIKCALFGDDEAGPTLAARREVSVEDRGRSAAVAGMLEWRSSRAAEGAVTTVAHRVVHGGETFERPCRLTPQVLATLDTMVSLAPNHLPDEIALIRAFMDAMPDATHVACFDTAFHRTLPDVARVVPLPGLRRFGFHGLSYAFLLSELERIAGADAARGRVILAHLGSGASLAAVKEGQSIDTTMGMTPAGGLVMSTRSGDLDPGAIAHIMRERHWTPDDLDLAVTKQSGLLEISGRTGDMQQLLAIESDHPPAALAVRVFCYQAAKSIGALTVALGGLDTIVFSGGIGEHAATIRQRIATALSCLGVILDADANARHAPVISARESQVVVRVIPTNEALVMARQARDLLRTEKDTTP